MLYATKALRHQENKYDFKLFYVFIRIDTGRTLLYTSVRLKLSNAMINYMKQS